MPGAVAPLALRLPDGWYFTAIVEAGKKVVF